MNKIQILEKISKWLDLYNEQFYDFRYSWYTYQERIDIIANKKEQNNAKL